MTGYQAPRCTCGHPVGSHLSAGTSWPHPSSYGLCTITDCPCTTFTQSSSREEPPHDLAAHHPGDTRGDRRDVAADIRRGIDHDRDERKAAADPDADPDADAGPGTAQPILLGLARTRVRALLAGLASGSALGALTALLAQSLAS